MNFIGNLLTDASIPSLIEILGSISSSVEVFGIFGKFFRIIFLFYTLRQQYLDNCYTFTAIKALIKIIPSCKLMKVMWLWSPDIKSIDRELALAIDQLPNLQFISYVGR